MNFLFLISFLMFFCKSTFAIDENLNAEGFIKNIEDNKIYTQQAKNLLEEYFKNPLADRRIFDSYDTCYGKTIDKDVSYLQHLSVAIPISLEINEIKIKGKSFDFNTTQDCKKFYPVSFISDANQNWLGINIEKDEKIEALYGASDSMENIFIFGDNYYPIMFENYSYKINKKYSKINSLKKHTHGDANEDTMVNYYRLTKKSGEIRYFFLNKFYMPSEVVNPTESVFKNGKHVFKVSTKFNFGITPYYGNKVCYLSDKVKIVFKGPEDTFNPRIKSETFFKEKYIKDNNSRNLYDSEGNVRKGGVFKPTKQDIIDGRRCNNKIAAYEKKTGKKIPYSNQFSKDQIESILKNHFYK